MSDQACLTCPFCQHATAYVALDTSDINRPHYRAWMGCEAHGWMSDVVVDREYREALRLVGVE